MYSSNEKSIPPHAPSDLCIAYHEQPQIASLSRQVMAYCPSTIVFRERTFRNKKRQNQRAECGQ